MTEAMRIDFLKLVVSASEGHLRAIDTKAQIVLAAFVLSWTPLWNVISASCSGNVVSLAPVVIVVLVVTVMAFGFAVWPSGPRKGAKSNVIERFYIGGGPPKTLQTYLSELQSFSTTEELAKEALKLAALRKIKSRRLRAALVIGASSYIAVGGVLLPGRFCG